MQTHICIFESLQLAGSLLVTYCIVEECVSISWRPFLMPAFRPCGCSLLPQAFQWLLSNLFLFGCLPRPTTSSLKIWHQSWTSNTLSTQDVERITTALNSAVLSGSVVSHSETLWTVACQAPLSWNSPGRNTGVGCHALLQGIFPTQDQTQVSYIAGRFFTIWATREAHEYWSG